MMTHVIRAYDYVNHPYEPVRDAVLADAAGILQRATKMAEERGDEIVAALEVNIAGLRVSKDVIVRVGALREEGAVHSRVTHVGLEWRESSPACFP